MLKPLMHQVLDEELKSHPEKEKEAEEKSAKLGQKLLDKLWIPEERPTSFWDEIKKVLSDEVDLPQKLFNRIIDFRKHHGLVHQKEEMQKVAFYATKAFCKGTEILARGCYLFYHNPQAFEKYATSSVDFNEDVHKSTFDEENVFMPALAMGPVGIAISVGQSECEEERAQDRRLPLLSFTPIKYGIHPAQIDSQAMFDHYQGLFGELSLMGFSYDSSRYEPLKKLLYIEQPESNYPVLQHKSIVMALNEFNRRLEREPVKVCTHKGGQPNTPHQHTKE